MNNFKVKVVEDNADINIYTDVSKIDINNDRISIVCGDGGRVIHNTDRTDEVVIKTNR